MKKARRLLITVAELVTLIVESFKGEASEKAVITTETEPQMYKKENPFFGRVTVLSTIECMLKFDYSNTLRMEREKAGLEQREIQKADWKERIGNSAIVRNKKSGQLYLEFEVKKYKSSQYLLDNKPCDKSVFAEFLKPKRERKEGEVNTYRLAKIENVKSVYIRNKLDVDVA
jgi:hypothetical protein